MSFKFNPFIGNFDDSGAAGSSPTGTPSSLAYYDPAGDLNPIGHFENASLSFGHSNGVLDATARGSFARGMCLTNSSLIANADGAYAWGVSDLNCTVTASGAGSNASGNAVDSGVIVASAPGTFAHGEAVTNASIQATMDGAIAAGVAVNGSFILSSGVGSVVIGHAIAGGNLSSSGNGSINIGYASSLDESSASTAANSATFGLGHSNSAYASLVAGRFSDITATPGSWVASEPLFILGNGADGSNRANAVQVNKDGTTLINAPAGFVVIDALFLTLPRQTSDPAHASLVAGAVYYNTTTNKIKMYNGATWETVTSV